MISSPIENAFVSPWDNHGRYTGESGFREDMGRHCNGVRSSQDGPTLWVLYIEISSLHVGALVSSN